MASAVASANPHNVAIKRIMREYAELQATPSPEFVANPLDDNLFEWHFTIAGAQETDYAGGRYHGRILLPSQYPFKPPDIMMLTPSGRFETHKKICLSISSFHPKNWQPSWSIRTVLTALIAFFPSPPGGAIGSLDYSCSEKRAYAHRSGEWTCELCGKCNRELLPYTPSTPAPKDSKFEPKASSSSTTTTTTATPTATNTNTIPTSPAPAPAPNCGQPDSTILAPPTPLLTSTVPLTTNPNMSSPKPSELSFSYAPNTPAKTPAMSRAMSEPTPTEMRLSEEEENKQPHPTPASSSSSPAEARVRPPLSVPPVPVPVPSPSVRDSMSHITVILAFLIIAILLRKLIAHINARAAVFDLQTDWELD